MGVLVLGTSGLIGSAVSAELAANGHDVVGINRRAPGTGLGGIRHGAFDLARSVYRPEPGLRCWRGDQFILPLSDRPIALTGAFFEALTIQDQDTTAPILDETGLVKFFRLHRNASASHAQHLCKKLLRPGQLIALGQVSGS